MPEDITKGIRIDRGYWDGMASRLRHFAAAAALVAAAATALPACGGSSSPVAVPWTKVDGLGHVVSVEAPTGAGQWLLGGGVVTPDGINHVTIWAAPEPGGPWRTASMHPFAGRDGPTELILGLAGGVALGSYRAPREGYPRPSTWTAAPGTGDGQWREVLANRELFGGPSIVAIGDDAGGGLTSGLHGYHIAGTWIGPANRVVASVWSSPDGTAWARNDVDPAFTAGPDTQSYGDDIADGATGLLMVGTTGEPSQADPAREVGSLWYSPDGSGWRRLPSLGGADQVAVDVDRAAPGGGWLAGGQRTTGGTERPAVWTVGADLRVAGATLPGPAAVVTDLAVTPAAAWAAGITGAGTPEVWTAPLRGGRPGGWRAVVAPAAGTGWEQARLAAAGGQVVLVLFDASQSEVWRS
jgi:hypothetical protein